MKSSLKFLVSLVGAMGLVIGSSYATVAQTSSVDSVGNQSPGANTPSAQSPNAPSNAGNSDATRTERPGTAPGTTNDPSYNQQPSQGGSNQRPSQGQYNQQPGTQPFGAQQMRPQANIEVPGSAGDMSIDEIVSQSSSFELLNALLRVANIEDAALVESLGGDESYVVYAPTDEAFAALPPDAIRTLVQPENRELLVELLSYHIVPEDDAMDAGVQASTEGEASRNAERAAAPVNEVDSPSQLSDSTSSLNTNSSEFPMMRSDRTSGSMMVNEARVIGSNIQASNGTIYPIDRVILPAELQSELSSLGVLPTTGTPSAISPNESNPSPGFSNPSQQRPF